MANWRSRRTTPIRALDRVWQIAEAILGEHLVWCKSEAELARRYGALESIWRKLGIRSWGAAPFSFEGRTLGSLSLSFNDERELGEAEREFLHASGQLTAQALERARLYEALQSSDERLRTALSAARAATWSVDLETMRAKRDPAYQALMGGGNQELADFTGIHPDDRHIARQHFERSLRDGSPYEPEVRVRRKDGTYIWMQTHGRVIRIAAAPAPPVSTIHLVKPIALDALMPLLETDSV